MAFYIRATGSSTTRSGTERRETVKGQPSMAVSDWPAPLAPEAFVGLAGEFVQLVGPESEADPASLLFSFLVTVGTIIGRGPYYQVGGDRHHTNLFAVIVGETAKSRKGMSSGRRCERLAVSR